MSSSPRFLASPIATNLTAAAVAGVVAYLRPGRIPTWARRGLLAVNAAGTGTSMFVGSPARGTGPTGARAPLAGKLGRRAAPIGGTADVLAAVTSGVALLTWPPALKLDARLHEELVRRGVRNPRLIVAVTAAGAVLAIAIISDQAAKAAERKAAELQRQKQTAELAEKTDD